MENNEKKIIKLVTTKKAPEKNLVEIIEHKAKWEEKCQPYENRITKQEESIKSKKEQIKKLESQIRESEDKIRKIKEDRYNRHPCPPDIQYLNSIRQHKASAFRATKITGTFDGKTSYLAEFKVDKVWYAETCTEENLSERKLTPSSSISLKEGN